MSGPSARSARPPRRSPPEVARMVGPSAVMARHPIPLACAARRADNPAGGSQGGVMSTPEPAPWLAGADVSPGQAAGLIRAQFPELAAATVTRLATGWDNTAFVVDDRWLFRFPRREIAVPGVRREL